MRLATPIVLGMAVTHIDVAQSASLATGVSSSSGLEHTPRFLVMAVTADGEMWVWQLKNQLNCMYRASLRPLVLSLRTRHTLSYEKIDAVPAEFLADATGNNNSAQSNKDSKISVSVERCHLAENGCVTVHCSSKGAAGGEWQVCAGFSSVLILAIGYCQACF